jgi:AraC-like DNA-binding protein
MRVRGPESDHESKLAAEIAREGSIQFVRLRGLPGVEVMDVRHVSRKWAYFHETYSLCVASWVANPRDIPWRYRQRTHQMNATGVQLMEPGEFHSNLIHAPSADFRVLMLAAEVVQKISCDLSGCHRPVHFTHAQLGAGPVRDALAALAAGVVDSGDAELTEARLYRAFSVLGAHGCLERGLPMVLGERSRRAVRLARDLIHEAWNEHLPLLTISQAADLPIATLERAFQRAYGTSPRQYQIHLRLMRAKELLRRGERQVVAAARACGFHDPKYFARLFKREFGCRPSEYRTSGQASAVRQD